MALARQDPEEFERLMFGPDGDDQDSEEQLIRKAALEEVDREERSSEAEEALEILRKKEEVIKEGAIGPLPF